ncbi:unnamed protein product [Calypogeia fissa]
METSAAACGLSCLSSFQNPPLVSTISASASAGEVTNYCRVKAAIPVYRFQGLSVSAVCGNSRCLGSQGDFWSLGTRGRGGRPFDFGRAIYSSADPQFQRRTFMKQSMAAGLLVCAAALAEPSAAEPSTTKNLDILPFKPEGYNYWQWRDHKVHYVVQGEGKPIVLIHGFGASVFHWRYNIPELAKHGYKVYAMDLLGFGWTDKALVNYSPALWKDQVADFLREKVEEPAVLVGNSVGGFTVLYTAASNPELVSGLALLNASGQFDSPEGQKPVIEETAVQRLFAPIKTYAKKWAIAFAFWQARQPARIKSVLQNVYKDQTNVDDYLVQSIVQPAKDANAGEAYYRMMTQMMVKKEDLTLNRLLSQLKCPLLLLWGYSDPWMGSTKANMIKELYPSAKLVPLDAGHCPHDESPELSNKAILDWVKNL